MRFILYIFTFILFITATISTASAMDSAYIVRDIAVDISAKDAVSARQTALRSARQTAFQALVNRLVLTADQPKVFGLNAPVVDLIKNFQIKNERRSSVRYLADITIDFSPDQVSSWFRDNNIRFSDSPSPNYLFLPIMEEDGQLKLWTEHGWHRAWKQKSLHDGLVRGTVPVGDLNDVQDLADGSEFRNQYVDGLTNIMDRYNTDQAIILIAVPHHSSQRLDILMMKYNKSGKLVPGTQQRITVNDTKRSADWTIFSLGVERSLDVLNETWRQATLIDQSVQNKGRLAVSFSDLRTWLKLQQDLRNVSLIDNLNINDLSQESAQLEFSFTGDVHQLQNALQSIGYKARYDGSETLETIMIEPEPEESVQIWDLDLLLNPDKDLSEIDVTSEDITAQALPEPKLLHKFRLTL